MYNAIDVANYIIEKSVENQNPVSNLKLQKLLYYSQAAKLVEGNGESLFGENISAWRYGPVVESTYHRFKTNVNSPIFEKSTNDSLFNVEEIKEYNLKKIISEEDQKIINRVVNSYKKYKPLDMVRKTHNEEPWINAYIEQKKKFIDVSAIKEYYSKHKELIYGLMR